MTLQSLTSSSSSTSSSPLSLSDDGSRTHPVERGDTLSGIAKEHGTTVAALLRANPQIDDPDRIYVGDLITLPPGARDEQPARPSVVTVHAGDTLSRLAREYDTDVATLARLNGIRNPNLIHVGDQLRLPGSTGSTTTPVTTPPVVTTPVVTTPGGTPQRGITEAEFAAVARELGVDVAAIKAVAEVESTGAGFLASGKPKVLFEAHKFHRYTDGAYDRSHPNLSSPHWNRALYGAGGEHQWERLDQARGLNERAALMSASWGRFQIMGFNYENAGFDNLSSFVAAMKQGEGEHLRAFANFIQSDAGMLNALRNHDWAGFALRYNGEGYAANQYDTKMAEAYARYAH